MFKKRCPKCKRFVEKGWNYCPYCGFDLKERYFFTPSFFDIFDEIEREFERIDKMRELFTKRIFEFPELEESEEFEFKPRFGGISITIRSGTGMKPKIEVKTFGDYKKLEPEIKRKFGVKEVEIEREREMPEITEEPEAEIRRIGDKFLIEVKLPDIKDERDIDIKKLEQSVEIRAFGKDKAYFKLIPIQKGLRILKKEFKDGILKIELG